MNRSAHAQSPIRIRPASPQDDPVIAEHFYQMWLDNEVSEQSFAPNWRVQVLDFIEVARRSLNYQAFVALDSEQIVGSVGCQRFAGLYPIVFDPSVRCDGYIWGVYVESTHRQQGIGSDLTKRAILYLQSIGCTQVVLNASPLGQPIYEQLGFTQGNLMRLPLLSIPE
jgi:ribosomal protein S18 acetylase RimI-like enzyme